MKSIPQNPNSNKGKIPIYITGKDKPIGYVSGNTFYKEISFSKHLLKQAQAILFDVSALKEAESVGATLANVTDRETGNVYTALISLIWQKPIYKEYTTRQVGLRLSEWTKNGIPPVTTSTRSQKPDPDPEQQPRLF